MSTFCHKACCVTSKPTEHEEGNGSCELYVPITVQECERHSHFSGHKGSGTHIVLFAPFQVNEAEAEAEAEAGRVTCPGQIQSPICLIPGQAPNWNSQPLLKCFT